MKNPPSEFFQPFLHQQRSQESQVALEFLVDRLEDELAESALSSARKYSSMEVKATAHSLENLVLRHSQPNTWGSYLQHEITRKSGAKRTLLEDVNSWLGNKPGQPVPTAMDEAISQLRLDYEIRYVTCPLSDAEFVNVKKVLFPAALREFLAQMLGRLTE